MAKITLLWMIAGAAVLLNLGEAHQHEVVKEVIETDVYETADVLQTDVVETDVFETDVLETDVYETDVVETDVYKTDVVETDVYRRPHAHVTKNVEVYKAAPTVKKDIKIYETEPSVVREDIEIVQNVHKTPAHVTHHGLYGDRYVTHGGVHHPHHYHKDVVIKDVHKTRPETHVIDKKYVAAPAPKVTITEGKKVEEEIIKFDTITENGSGEDDDPDLSDD